MNFVLGHPLMLEESLTCEFKEVSGTDPVQTIGKTVDEYAVALLNAAGGSVYWGVRDRDRVVVGLNLDYSKRDRLRQVVGQKLAAIAPPIPSDVVGLPFHPVSRDDAPDVPAADLFVVEISVQASENPGLYFTGSGEAYKKTLGGKIKLTGSELIALLYTQLGQKQQSGGSQSPDIWGPLADFVTSVNKRAEVVAPLVRGRRIIWVDDIPGHTIYERTALSALGIGVDVSLSTEDALFMMPRLKPDLIISDIRRGASPIAGLELLLKLRSNQIMTPLIFYVGQLDARKPKPEGSFGITNLPSELFHLVFDVLERIRSAPG